MALDGVVIRAIRAELQEELVGGRIEKIYQPLARDILIQVRKHGQSKKVLISANQSYPRVLITHQYEAQNPTEPPMFCMLLRKHLEGGIIKQVEQVSNERI